MIRRLLVLILGVRKATKISGTTDTELRDSRPSNMHAPLYLFYPDKKKLYSSRNIGSVMLRRL